MNCMLSFFILQSLCDDFSDKIRSSSLSAGEACNTDRAHSDDSVSLVSACSTSQSQSLVDADSALTTSAQAEKRCAKSRPTCLLCSKSFHNRYKLNEHHAVVHLDKRLFSCNVCQKTFGRADHLIRHVRNRVCIPRQQHQLLEPSQPGNRDICQSTLSYSIINVKKLTSLKVTVMTM